MNFRTLISASTIALFTLLAMSTQLAAQQHHHYKLVDLGTLGGPSGYGSVNGAGYQILNNAGVVAFGADTSMTDPNAPNLCYTSDCFVPHATRWQNGVLTNLGALPGAGNGSLSGAVNARGWVGGQSENGAIDPVTGIPEVRAVVWKDGQIIDLGTFGGNWSLVSTLNNAGQAVGFATNAIPDPLALFIGGTQTRAFLWQSGVLQDLGTLGGLDAEALSMNQVGQVVGTSYTDATPNPTTGIPTVHPFLWDHGRMTDLGTLGGTYAGAGSCSFSAIFCNSSFVEGALLVNDAGQVVGSSNLAGDLTLHPFLWTRTGGMQDLGTLGGNNGVTNWINDVGDIVGKADLPGPLPQNHDAVLWRNGVMMDLGTLPGDSCSNANSVNLLGQVVGTSESRELCLIPIGEHASLWEKGGPMVDLNTLILGSSGATLYEAVNINERGEILALGLPAGCDDRSACGHLYLLVPCDANNASACQNSAPNALGAPASPAVANNSTGAATPRPQIRGENAATWRTRVARQFHIPAVASPKN